MNWSTVALGDICAPKQWKTLSKKELLEDGHPVFGANGQIGYYNKSTHDRDTLLVGCRGSCGTIHIMPAKGYANGNAMALGELREDIVSLNYLARFLKKRGFADVITGTSQPQIIKSTISAIEIPLPPLEEQRRIAGILDAADALRRRRREALALLDTLPGAIFAEMFDGNTDIDHREIGELGRVVTGATPPSKKENMFGGAIPFVTPGDLEGNGSTVRTLTEEGALASRTVRGGSTLVCCIGATIGKISQFNESVAFNQQINAVEWGDEIEPAFGTQAMRLIKANIIGSAKSTTLPILKKSLFEKLQIPVVSIERQRKFAGLVESVEAQKESMKAHLSEIETLFASLQSRAFAGEL